MSTIKCQCRIVDEHSLFGDTSTVIQTHKKLHNDLLLKSLCIHHPVVDSWYQYVTNISLYML